MRNCPWYETIAGMPTQSLLF